MIWILAIIMLYILFYAVVGIFAIKWISKTVFKKKLNPSELMLIVSLIIIVLVAIDYFYTSQLSMLLLLASMSIVAVRSYVDIKKRDDFQR